MPNEVRSAMATKWHSARVLAGPGLLLVLNLGLWTAGCETGDPCVLRQTACMEVHLLGDHADLGKTLYKDIKVTVTSGKAGNNAMLASAQVPELKATAQANVEGMVHLQMPDSFNALPDMPWQPQIDNIADPMAKVAKLKMLRDTDPRAVHVTVSGTNTDTNKPVAWDSRIDEDLCFSADLWLMHGYYRVGKDAAGYPEDASVHALLLPPVDTSMPTCPPVGM